MTPHLLPPLLAILLFFSAIPALGREPCPVCGGKVTTAGQIVDLKGKSVHNLELWDFSYHGWRLPSNTLVCTRCWFISKWEQEEWTRIHSKPDTFFRPLSPAIRQFPVPAEGGNYIQEFLGGSDVTESISLWCKDSEELVTRFNDYGKEHGLAIEVQNRNDPSYPGKMYVRIDTKPGAVLTDPLPPKRPVELKSLKAEYQRSTDARRTRYISDLLELRAKAKSKKDDVACRSVERELKTMVLPMDSDSKALSKLLIGNWKPENGSVTYHFHDGFWNFGSENDKTEEGRWRVERNEVVETSPDGDGVQSTRRRQIILLNQTQFVYLYQFEDLPFDISCEERIPEKKRR